MNYWERQEHSFIIKPKQQKTHVQTWNEYGKDEIELRYILTAIGIVFHSVPISYIIGIL